MASNTVKNYYEILEISVNSTTSEIKSAYRKLARKYHPDVNKTSEAVEIFKQINLAYETLIDEDKRRQYDTINGIFKTENPKTQYTSSQKAQELYNENVKKTYTSPSYEKPVKKNKNKFGFIKSLKYWCAKLKKQKRTKELHKPQKGENITTEVAITPDEVITGSKRIVNIRTTKTCPQCFGHKFANGDKCSRCQGRGSITETKRITVNIPKGIKHGTKLRLKGEGASGKNGGPNGDVYIIIKIETKTQVHYDKLNIYYNVPITPYEAALGEEISIPSFDGTIKLKLPKNTCSGQKFRVAKQGIKKNGKVGDLIVTVSIEFSQNLSDDEIRLYEQLKNLSKDDVRKNFGYGS